jgi:pSer/pThr/pTyr-binding forkhead associated (FHA) protein
MPITIIVRHGAGEDTRLTFDGTQRVVIGRGPGSDVRLPDASVSHRHASLRGQGSDFVLVDEGSTNGTFVGAVRIAARTSRLVRSGDTVRVGRVFLELRIDQSPVTRDVAAATRDLALALVSQAMAAMGTDRTPKVRVVEGRDQGSLLVLARDEHPYLVGRAPHCDLLLDDPDSSREHLWVIVRGDSVFLRDRAAKNGTFVGDVQVLDNREVLWRPAIMVRIGRTVLALEEPISHALADLERAEDEPLRVEDEPLLPTPADAASAASPVAGVAAVSAGPAIATPLVSVPPAAASRGPRARARWSVADLLVMAAALSVLALSLAGLVWLLHG